MTDIYSPERRSEIMGLVRASDTKPEIFVRQCLHRLGYRFRLHDKSLPGCPDIILPRHQTVVFVHGCFWHGHSCRKGRRPKSNRKFWDAKLDRNQDRDRENYSALRSTRWRVGVIWECETNNGRTLVEKVLAILGGTDDPAAGC